MVKISWNGMTSVGENSIYPSDILEVIFISKFLERMKQQIF